MCSKLILLVDTLCQRGYNLENRDTGQLRQDQRDMHQRGLHQLNIGLHWIYGMKRTIGTFRGYIWQRSFESASLYILSHQHTHTRCKPARTIETKLNKQINHRAQIRQQHHKSKHTNIFFLLEKTKYKYTKEKETKN